MKYTITITNDVGTMDYMSGLTLEEATLICGICARQSEPHDAVMKIEAQ